MPDLARMTVDHSPRAEDVARVRAGLRAFNESRIGGADFRPLAVFLRDAADDIVGGLSGYLAWRWLSVEYLWLPESLRGQGFGTRLLRQAEEEARAAGCVAARLDTFEFQARPFYEKQGYRLEATVAGFPGGTSTHYLTKPLAAPAP